MRSRISLFDKTLFRKDLSRFAPLWALYTLCLFVGMSLLYFSEGSSFRYAPRMMELLREMMPLVNLVYGGLAAMLLFGDLCDSRMCNAIHALPLRRETMFLTHIAAGLCYSLCPTLLFSLGSLPLLMGTCVVDAWVLAPLWFLAVNLQYILFFGLAVLTCMCTGNRVAMLLLYGIANVLSPVVYFLIEAFYTPMLYGVVTPISISETLNPFSQASVSLTEFDNYGDLLARFRGREQDMVAHYTFQPDQLWQLVLCAGAGVLLLAAALLLYRRRHLERAGDALAVKALEPLAPILGGIGAVAVGWVVLIYVGLNQPVLTYALLALALAVGWFAGKMLLSRSTRVFYGKNAVGLAALAGCLALSLVGTYFDVLKIDDRIPKAQDVASVFVSAGGYGREYTDPQDIETILTIQEDVLQERLVSRGREYYPHIDDFAYTSTLAAPELADKLEVDETGVISLEETKAAMDKLVWYPFRATSYLDLTYTLKNGRTMVRNYDFWVDSQAGELLRGFQTDWDALYKECFGEEYREDGTFYEEADLDNIYRFYINAGTLSQELPRTKEVAQSLLAALKADCEAGNLIQNNSFHKGFFSEGPHLTTPYFYVHIRTATGELFFDFYADSEHTIQWLRDQGITEFLVTNENIYPLDADKEWNG